MSVSTDLLVRGAARGIHVAASLAILGTTAGYRLFAQAGLQRDKSSAARNAQNAIVKFLRASFAVAVIAGLIWLLCEAIYASGSNQITSGFDAILPLLRDTNFGHLLIIRMILMAGAVLVFGHGQSNRRVLLAGSFAAVAVALQAGLGHGAAMGGAEGHLLLATLILHLLAAGLWLGGLVSLLIVVKAVTPEAAFRAATWFSRLGIACVITIAVTAAIQGWYLIGSIPALTGTAYGLVAVGKLALFLILLAIAAMNRWQTSRLTTLRGQRAKDFLYKSIAIETAIGLTVVVLAGILMELPPAMDIAKMNMTG
ncbi:CopD family protein [Acidiphilium sp. AL]|uniref:copper resistance D family protein n=1 Tax=Acidiphilium sp. AL TaxID=2871704 RepID=UPI0021CB63B4|nr:CopD family protein [Acidiphilium sp. AL]MCU4162091.1 CopD family protein [Acidiphilium sp. AL]